MLVQEFLTRSAIQAPDKIGLICEDQRLSYSELDRMTSQFANALQSQGIGRHDRVAIYLPNSVATVVAIFGILKAGSTFVVVNETTKQEKLEYILNNCQASGLITAAKKSTLAEQVCREVSSIKGLILTGAKPEDFSASASAPTLFVDNILADYSDDLPEQTNIELDLACLIYTSGSTGEPKGVMSDHSNVDFATSSIIEYLENTSDDIVINVLPLSFDYGLYQLLMTFKFSGTLVLERSFTYPAAALNRIKDEAVTGFPGVPTIFSVLLNLDLAAFNLKSLRYVTNTAAALPPSHIQELRQLFPEVTIYSMYGLTETKRTLYLPPSEIDNRPGSVGIAIPGTEVWIEDENGNRLGPGEVGELVVRGRHVMRGYWEAPEISAERFRNSNLPGERLCYTGDLFKQDEDGFLYFVGRKDDIIKSRGEKVAPKEVENILYALAGVKEAAVIGVDDPILGEAIKAILVVDGQEISERLVIAHCRANLEDFMVPKYVEFRSELPKTSSRKIKKTDLA